MKSRADEVLLGRGLASDLAEARALIMAGVVFSGETRVEKPGRPLDRDSPLEVRKPPPFASRAGLKLAAALDRFEIDPAGLIALDVGSSTGGFTDCLLQRGARRVVAVDVDIRQLEARLRADPRVATIEKNARALEPGDVPEPPDLAVMDVSFISVLKILPALRRILTRGTLLVLVKPQFEAPRGRVGRGGVVRDAAVHAEVLEGVIAGARGIGFEPRGVMRPSTRGRRGNREFFVRFAPGGPGSAPGDIAAWIKEALTDEED
jgi:23S rRNA (cytidine1920-2'-O)/16S rRNA (cytidine1409-2'-O)-methyltransferase